MTQTECMDCDYSENCDWTLIERNMVPMSPPCAGKQWHEESLEMFAEQTEVVRARIITAANFRKGSNPWLEYEYQGA